MSTIDPTIYKLLNSDLNDLSDIEALDHYRITGLDENRLTNVDIPNDFFPYIYRALNADLYHLPDLHFKAHYFLTGQYENRLYRLNIPNDFDANIYIALNQDLKCNPFEAKIHYTLQGKVENRLYKLDLPDDFDVEMYLAYNKDIQHLSNLQAKIHYMFEGKKEGRRYSDQHFDKQVYLQSYNTYLADIRQKKNNYFEKELMVRKRDVGIILVNHDNSLYGASRYIHNLYKVLKKEKKSVMLCEVGTNGLDDGLDKYANDIIYYYNDPTMLYMIYNFYKPQIFYLNSCNFAFSHVVNYIPKDNLILHSHEIPSHYCINKIPDFVVSEQIARMYGKECPKIRPPFIYDIEKILKLSNEPVSLKFDKITICMCGSLTERKNFKLFKEVADVFPQYTFLWIGGENGDVFQGTDNIFYVPFTNNVYKYFNQVVDYFMLFSEDDPCPYVVLENILLGNEVIVFSENIYTSFPEEIVHTVQARVSFDICKKTIEELVLKKKEKRNTNGIEFVKKCFS